MAETKSYYYTDLILKSPTYPLTLRPYLHGDEARLAHLLNLPPFGEAPAPPEKQLTEEWAKGAISRAIDYTSSNPTVVDLTTNTVISGPSRLSLLVVEHADDGSEKVIGVTGYGAIKDWTREGKAVRAGDAGVVLDEAVRGKGYAVEVMKMSMDWAVAPASEGGLQLDIVTVTTLETNKPMIQLTEDKLGLKGLGLFRPAEFDKEKQELYFEIPAAKWKEIRGKAEAT